MEKLFEKKEIMKLLGADKYLETAISELFFTEKFAYKIKKSVKLDFVDFTKQSERNRISKEEFRINKKISPSIYLRLIPIAKNNKGDLSVAKKFSGKSMEYALQMVYLPADGCLVNLLSKKQVDKKLVLKLAKTLSNCHKKLKSDKVFLKYGKKESIKRNLENVFNLIEGDFDENILSRKEFEDMKNKSRIIFNNSTAIFDKRWKEKRIQRIHGDLHSENIFMKNEVPYITDAILPISEWQYGDYAIDVGALAMDLDAYEQVQLSNVLVNEYAREKKDNSISKVISFYKLSWALIRFWVNLLTYKQGKKEAKGKIKLYKNLIFKYLDIR